MALSQWMNRAVRGGGEYNTPNMTVPAGISRAYVELDVLAGAFNTPDKSITLTIEISRDGAASWEHQMAVGWIGQDPPPGKSGKWYAEVNGFELLSGLLFRVHFSTSGSFRWGLRGETR